MFDIVIIPYKVIIDLCSAAHSDVIPARCGLISLISSY